MALGEFIKENEEQIMREWEDFARNLLPKAERLDPSDLRNGIRGLLKFISDELETQQIELDKTKKLPTGKRRKCDATKNHAGLRFLEGFDTVQIASEFLALRTSVTKLWEADHGERKDDVMKLIGFNEIIDQLLLESLAYYTDNLNRSRTLFLGTLIHDMRNPLGTITSAAQLISRVGALNDKQTKLAAQIGKSAAKISMLVADLIDATRIRLGQKLPIKPAPMDLVDAVDHAVKEAMVAHPEQEISVETAGNLTGAWDGARIGQVLSNLIGNAVQHGKKEAPVKVTAKGEGEAVELSVHNEGEPIPPMLLPAIFNPMTRGDSSKQACSETSSLGLGLFIAREIVTAHGGKIDVESSDDAGTTFIATLPRVPPEMQGRQAG